MNYKHCSLLLLAGITYIAAFAQPRIKDQGVIGGKADDLFSCMYLTKDGGLIAGGFSSSNISGEKTEDSRGTSDYWIVKLDSNHKIQWDKTIGGSSGDNLQAVQQTTDGGYILGGLSNSSISGEKTENSRGDKDYWIVKTNSRGKVQWDKTIGGSVQEKVSTILEIKKNDYVVGGYSSSGVSGDKTGGSRGKSDYWLVELKYVKPDSVAIAQIQNNSQLKESLHNNTFLAYPNPASDIVHVQVNGSATITLTNAAGKVILTRIINNNADVNVSAFSSGTYYLQNKTTGETQKIVIVH